MSVKFTEEQLNNFDKAMLIQLFLNQQEQLESIDSKMQLLLEQMADMNRHRFGRSSEKSDEETITVTSKGYTKVCKNPALRIKL